MRHAESLGNVDKNTYKVIPDNQVPLTQEGLIQAEVLGSSNLSCEVSWTNQYPYISYIYYSPYLRAVQTKNGLVRSKTAALSNVIKEIEHPLIYEQVYSSNYEHMVVDLPNHSDSFSTFAKNYGAFWYKENGAESFADVYLRAKLFLSDLKQTHSKEDPDILVISHGIFLRMLQGIIQELSVAEILEVKKYENCEVRSFCIKGVQ